MLAAARALCTKDTLSRILLENPVDDQNLMTYDSVRYGISIQADRTD